jgi:hypothetical protein
MTTMKEIYDIIRGLRAGSDTEGDTFNVASLPDVPYHKIGISRSGEPMFFIHSTGSDKSLDINLELISVLFNRSCKVQSNGEVSSEVFTIVSLRTHNPDLQKYFVEIVYLVVRQLPDNPPVSLVKAELNKLIHLFSNFSKPPIKSIQGLWSELLLIEQSSDPDYLVNAWHVAPTDKFDFNDGQDKVEVKSTAKSRRIHSFSMEQLNTTESANLIIASTFVIEVGVGKSIYDLIDAISFRLKLDETRYKLNESVAKTLGSDLEKALDIFFDYGQARDSLQLYDFKTIPSIAPDAVPAEVQNVRFDSDLTSVVPIETDSLASGDSQLFKSIVAL